MTLIIEEMRDHKLMVVQLTRIFHYLEMYIPLEDRPCTEQWQTKCSKDILIIDGMVIFTVYCRKIMTQNVSYNGFNSSRTKESCFFFLSWQPNAKK